MRWTKRQEEAIFKRKRNMLVSAAAGSGKTAVLVERIKQLVLVEKVPIDEILVVTFTKAAALEMKEKIINAIYKEIGSNPKEISYLKEQLNRISKGNISTFHGFAMDIVKKYFYVIDINPSLKICDEAQGKIMKNQGIDKVFHQYFEEENQDFFDFLKSYSKPQNDNTIKEALIALYDKIQAMIQPLPWLKEQVENLEMDEEEYINGPIGQNMIERITKEGNKALAAFEQAEKILEEQGLFNVKETITADIVFTKELLSLENIHEIKKALEKYEPLRLAAKGKEKEPYKEVKDVIKKLRDCGKGILLDLKGKELVSDISLEVDLICKTKKSAEMIYEILERFHTVFQENKKTEKLLDFNDIEHYSISILKNEKVAEEFRNKFQYIFIDEYQDSNFLQEEIIKSIKREDNLFMVGDIKQSIYGFRLAEPEIFARKYKLFKQEDEKSCVIDLNENFRSKEPIIHGINQVFSKIMAGYTDDAKLYSGIKVEEKFQYLPDFNVIDLDKNEDLKEELADMDTAYLEAIVAAEKIEANLGKSIYDVKTNAIRPMEYRDMVILMRSIKTAGEIFYKVFSDRGIPLYIGDNSGYFNTMELMLMLDLLRTIDNKRQDVPLLAVLRSCVFDFSIEELIEIRLAEKAGSYHTAFSTYEQKGEDKLLKKKVSNTLFTLNHWKEESRFLPLSQFVWQVMNQSGIYSYVGVLPGGEQRQANLRVFIEKIGQYMKGGNHTIYGLIQYVEAIGDKKIETSQAELMGENENIVRLMTIHKSKGLEFPMVMVTGLGKTFRQDKLLKTGVIHKDIGIGIPYIHKDYHIIQQNQIQKTIANRKKEEDLEEEIRILYVAMTRAVDHLVLIGSRRKWESESAILKTGVLPQNSYLEYIWPAIDENLFNLSQYQREDFDHKITPKVSEITEKIMEKPQEINKEVSQRLSYIYPHQADLKRKFKFTVSEINEEKETSRTRLQIANFNGEEGEMSGSERGSVMHRIMEFLDFNKAFSFEHKEKRQSYISLEIDKMVDFNILTKHQMEQVKIEKLDGFFESSLGKRVKESHKVVKEQPFNMLYDYEGSQVMVQGIIDCYFYEGEEIVLVDYKSNWKKEGIEKKYAKQIELYKRALESATALKVKEAYLYLFSTGDTLKME